MAAAHSVPYTSLAQNQSQPDNECMASRVLWCSARLGLCLLSLLIFLGSFELLALGNGTPGSWPMLAPMLFSAGVIAKGRATARQPM